MQCSCPDWAVPCKHLAAVIYMMSREIDNNPFLVFTIHNVDLLEELKKRGVTVDEAAKTAAVPSVKDVVEFRKPAKEVDKEAPGFHRVNFSRLSDRLDVLLMLLPPNPAFDLNGDFKERYSSQMRKISGNAVKFFEGKLPAERLFPPQALSNEYNEYALSGDSGRVAGSGSAVGLEYVILHLTARSLPRRVRTLSGREIAANHRICISRTIPRA